MNATWGTDNRTTAVRAIPGGKKSSRVELRLTGADINPYLAMADSARRRFGWNRTQTGAASAYRERIFRRRATAAPNAGRRSAPVPRKPRGARMARRGVRRSLLEQPASGRCGSMRKRSPTGVLVTLPSRSDASRAMAKIARPRDLIAETASISASMRRSSPGH